MLACGRRLRWKIPISRRRRGRCCAIATQERAREAEWPQGKCRLSTAAPANRFRPGRYIVLPERTGKRSTRACRHQYATRSPPAAPMLARIRPSVRSCFNNRPLVAPIAIRTVISWRRANDRTSNKLPTLAQAMSRTNATTAVMISSVGSRVPALLNGVCHKAQSLKLRPRFVAG